MDIKVPKKLKVAGFDYKVIWGDENLELASNQRYGHCNHLKPEIQVETRFGNQHKNHTFIHELLHAVNEEYNNGNIEESENSRLAHGLHQVFEQLGINFVE